MTILFEITDEDGDKVSVQAQDSAIPGVAFLQASREGVNLSAEDVTTIRTALAPLDPEWTAEPEPVDDDRFGAGYSEGHADGFAEGMDEALGAPFIIRTKALQAAAEVAKGLRATGFGTAFTGAVPAEDVIAYAAFLLGELPLADDDDLDEDAETDA